MLIDIQINGCVNLSAYEIAIMTINFAAVISSKFLQARTCELKITETQISCNKIYYVHLGFYIP